MKQSTIIVYITLAVLIAAAFLTGGRALVAEGLIISANTAYKSAVMLIASFIITGQLNVLLIALSVLTAIAETFWILLPKIGAVSVSFALTFCAILLTNPLTVSLISAIGMILRCPYMDGKGRVHIFNNPIYKTVFNVSQYIVSFGIAGIVYEAIDKSVNFILIFFNPVAGTAALFVYIILTTFYDNSLVLWKNSNLNINIVICHFL
jgi:hypothetical protein